MADPLKERLELIVKRVNAELMAKRLKAAGTFIDNHKYWCSLAAIFSALLCLLLYTSSQGIPFPISLLGSPELILLIMAVAFLVPLLLSFLMLIPLIITAIASSIFDWELFEKIYPLKGKIISGSNFVRFGLTVGLPQMIIWVSFYIYKDQPTLLLLWIAVLSVIFGCVASWWFSQKGQRTKIVIATIAYNFVFFIWGVFLFLILFKLCVRYFNLPEWASCPIYMSVVFASLLFCYSTTSPVTNSVGISRFGRLARLLIIPAALFLYVPVNVYSFGVALYGLKMGGGCEVYYSIDANDKKYFPEDFFETNAVVQNGLLKTKKLKILLRTQNEIYIKTSTPDGERIVEVDNQKIIYPEYPNTKS